MRLSTVVLSLMLGASGCAAVPHAVPSDAEITSAVQKTLNQHPDLGPPTTLYVQTLDHVVYLSGIADTGLQREIAASLAMQTKGVARVVDNISVSH
jgi:osmotically-inducible protein OsmY